LEKVKLLNFSREPEQNFWNRGEIWNRGEMHHCLSGGWTPLALFHQTYGSFRSIFGLISSIFHVFATQQRFLSPVQLLVIRLTMNCFINPASTWKILFYHSSFYFNNVICIFLRG